MVVEEYSVDGRRSNLTNGSQPSIDVLVLDGETRAALAVVRSLGSRGIRVAAASCDGLCPTIASRYVRTFRKHPNPRQGSAEFLSRLNEIVDELQPNLLLPVSDLSWDLLLRSDPNFPARSLLPKMDESTFRSASDKSRLLKAASELGLLVPRSEVVVGRYELPDGARDAIEKFAYPAVLKPESSEQQIEGVYKKPAPKYLSSPDEVFELLRSPVYSGVRCLLQQQIHGAGVGVFALCNAGDPIAVFCHERLLEKPPSGGPSVLCESIPESNAPVKESLSLLKALRWNGVAMVEFKRSSTGEFFLMEINPRFWGSLQLAIDSGRDFPALYYRFLAGESADSLKGQLQPFTTGNRLRWDLGTIDHALIRLKNEGRDAVKAIFTENALRIFSRPASTRHETFRFNDPLPFVYEIISYVRDLVR